MHPSMSQQLPDTITLPELGEETVRISATDSSGHIHMWAFNKNGLLTYSVDNTFVSYDRLYPNLVEILCPDARVAPIAHKLVTCPMRLTWRQGQWIVRDWCSRRGRHGRLG